MSRPGGLRNEVGLVLCAFLTGCGAASTPAAVPGSEAEPTAPPGTGLVECTRALEEMQDAPVAERAAIFAGGCAGLFGQPMCREAIRMSAAARPDLRAPMIAVACQHAYCPFEEAPEPAFCQADVARIAPSDLSEVWGPFVDRVLRLELGEAPPAEMSTLLARLFAVVLFEPTQVDVLPGVGDPARDERPRLVVSLVEEGGTYRLTAELAGETFGPHDLPLRPDAGDLAGLLEAPMGACDGCEAVIQAGLSLDYGIVVVLMDVLRRGGVSAFSLAPAGQ